MPKHYTVSDGELVLLLWPAEEGGYAVTSPLDPALNTQAETVEEAFVMARDAWELLNLTRTAVCRERQDHEGHIMSQTLKTLGIDQLSVEQRILLIEEIWDSISAEAEDLPLTDAQRQDLEHRLAAYNDNPNAGSSWEEVKARLSAKS